MIIWIILSSNNIQLLERQQFLNYYLKNWNIKCKKKNTFYILRPLPKNMVNRHNSLANKIACILSGNLRS